MSITWVTLNATRDTVVEYGLGQQLTLTAKGTQSNFTDGGALRRVIYIHRVLLTDLKPLQTYSESRLLPRVSVENSRNSRNRSGKRSAISSMKTFSHSRIWPALCDATQLSM